MKPLISLILLLLIPVHAQAQTPMTAAEFDAYTRGKTFYYGSLGEPYGAEEYLDGRRVRWSFLDGKCKDGEWYVDQNLICFIYEDEPVPECWLFTKGNNGMSARFVDANGDPNPTELYEVDQTAKPMLCLGPEVGV